MSILVHMNHRRPLLALLAAVVLSGVACRERPKAGAAKSPVTTELTLWHTFNREETTVLNELLDGLRRSEGWRVHSSVIPFAHAQTAYARGLAHCAPDSPDVLRVEFPWLAGFVEQKWLVPVPSGTMDTAALLPAPRRSTSYRNRQWAMPASIDGLALLYNKALVPDPPTTLRELVALGKRLTVDSAGRNAATPGFQPHLARRWGFYVRADGYWFLPFLWAHGGRLLDPVSRKIFINDERAVHALTFYRDLSRLHHIAPPHLRLSNDYEDQMQRFGRGEVAMTVNGPWATAAILKGRAFVDPSNLGIAPFPRGPSEQVAAPGSGHGYVVSICSRHPARAWALARRLSDQEAQVRFAQGVGLLPSLAAVYDDARVKNRPTIGAFRQALSAARDRPKHPLMSKIFDDFSPAVQSVLLGDATPREALEGVARSWARLFGDGGGKS